MGRRKEINGLNDYYVDEDGYILKKDGNVFIQLATKVGRNGHVQVIIGDNTYSVRFLIYETFNGPCPVNSTISHINGDRFDNRLINLRISNIDIQRGIKHWGSKLNEDNIREIRKLHNEGLSIIDISRRFNISRGTACKIINKQLWGHI